MVRFAQKLKELRKTLKVRNMDIFGILNLVVSKAEDVVLKAENDYDNIPLSII